MAGTLAFLLVWLSLAAPTGCGNEKKPAEWLSGCGQAARNYVEGGGYLHFVQESHYEVSTDQGTLKQQLYVEGDIIFPERERYDYREEVSSTKRPGEVQANAFSYLTLDGGKTAYVAGERLASQLGVAGWIHYTPPAGQNRYFDYSKLVEKIITAVEDPEWMGYEEVENTRCAHLGFNLSGRELLDLRLQEDPSILEKYRDLDLETVLGQLRVEIWIAEEGMLPIQVLMQAKYGEEGIGAEHRLRLLFTRYWEEPPFPLERPAVFTEAG